MSEDNGTPIQETKDITELEELRDKLASIRSDYINVVMRHCEENFNPTLPEGVDNNIKTGAVLIIYTQVKDELSDQFVADLQLGTTMPKDLCMHVLGVTLDKVTNHG